MNDQNNSASQGVISAEDRSFGPSKLSRARRVRTRKALKIVLVTLIAILLVICCTFTAIVMPLLQAYNNSYSKVPIIAPPSSFIEPDFPENQNGTYPHIGENGNWWVGDVDTGIRVEYSPTPETDEDGEEFYEALNVPVVGDGGNWMIGGTDTGIKSDVSTDIPEPDPDDTTYPDEDDDPISSGGKPVTVNGIYRVDRKDPDVENILLVGTDSRNMSSLKGRSDTMIVCSYNKRTGEAKLVSFMRDTLVPIEGLGANGAPKWQRLNATFSLIGIASTVNTINQIFDLDIQRFIIVNFEGTTKLVDACGGVDVKLTNTPGNSKGEVQYIIASGGKVIDNGNGTYHLDGTSALIHMRQRYGGSDVNRTQRQRNVLMALFRQVVSSRDVTEIYDLVRQGFGMIQTNIPLDEMIDLAASVVSNGSNMSIGSYRIPTTYKSIYFNMGKQEVVPYGTKGAASVLQIDTELQRAKVQEFIYGN